MTTASALQDAAAIVSYIDIKNSDDTASIGAMSFATHSVLEKYKNEDGLITEDGQFFLHAFFKTLLKEGLDPMQARGVRDSFTGEINNRIKEEEERKAKEAAKKNSKKNAKQAALEKAKTLSKVDYYRANNYRNELEEQQADYGYDDDDYYYDEEDEEYDEEYYEEPDAVAIAEAKKAQLAAEAKLSAKATSGTLADLLPTNKTKSKTLVLGGKK